MVCKEKEVSICIDLLGAFSLLITSSLHIKSGQPTSRQLWGTVGVESSTFSAVFAVQTLRKSPDPPGGSQEFDEGSWLDQTLFSRTGIGKNGILTQSFTIILPVPANHSVD